MTAEAFVERHGPVILKWLQANTVECACSTPFGPDENLQRGTIDLTTSIACRRCYTPLSLQDVRLPRGDPSPQPWPGTERPPPPLRSPAFAQILDHVSGLRSSISSIAGTTSSDWEQMMYKARRGVPCLLYQRVVDELGCAPPRVHLCTAALARAWSAHLHGCGRSPVGALSRALYAVRWQVDQQRPGRRMEASPLGRQPPLRSTPAETR